MPVLPPNFYHCILSLKHSALARSAAVTWGGQATDPPITPDAVALACHTAFVSAIGGSLDSQVTMGPTRIELGTDGEPLISVDSTLTSGSSSGDRVPANVALLVKKSTSLGGRQNQGRMYLPWALEDGSVDDVGVLGTSPRAGWQDAFDDFLANLSSADIPLAVLHSPCPHGDEVPALVTAMLVDPRMGTQRRRLAR